MKNLLPIGSVVLLKEATKKLMIFGILQTNTKDNKLYDYIGVPYPEGFLGATNNFLFDHEDINDVIFEGYSNPEREVFMNLINKLNEFENAQKTGEGLE